jgi:hypothetical protein
MRLALFGSGFVLFSLQLLVCTLLLVVVFIVVIILVVLVRTRLRIRLGTGVRRVRVITDLMRGLLQKVSH